MDILLLNGTRLEGFPRGKEPTNRLYRNNRNGSFGDVTEKAGLRDTGWASAVCAATTIMMDMTICSSLTGGKTSYIATTATAHSRCHTEDPAQDDGHAMGVRLRVH